MSWYSRIRISRVLGTFGFCALLVTSFQNCSAVNHSGSTSDASKKGGEPYGGMVDKIYRHFSQLEPCTTLDQNGSPLANDMIIFKADPASSASPYLTRQNCKELTPAAIAPADLQTVPSSSTSFVYRNQTFSTNNTPGEFDILRAACPAGKTAIPNAVRNNLLASPLDWTANGWYSYAGISTGLYGSIQSLPSYLVQRSDANQLDEYRGVQQSFNVLKASTDYAYSFLVQPGSLTKVDWSLIRCDAATDFYCKNSPDESVTVTVDLQTLTATTQWDWNIPNLKTVVSPLGNAFAVTVYFTSSPTDATPGQMIKLIVSPSAQGQPLGQLGDSIIATAAELEEVAAFCQ